MFKNVFPCQGHCPGHTGGQQWLPLCSRVRIGADILSGTLSRSYMLSELAIAGKARAIVEKANLGAPVILQGRQG